MVISGSGALYSDAAAALADWIEHTGMTFYTTPQGRDVVPEHHRFFYANARSKALREAEWSWWSAHDSTMFSGTGRRSASPRR